jgi:hypothetical protein
MAEKGPLNPIVESYGQACDYMKANQGSRTQRTDWPANQWIYLNESELVICKLITGEMVLYQDIDGYDLSGDLLATWQVVG